MASNKRRNAKRISLHPDNPQQRLLAQVVDSLQQGGLIAYPSDSGYLLGCAIGLKEPLVRMRQLRNLDKQHLFTLMCQDLSMLGQFARVNNPIFRLLKRHTPGLYTFVLPASHEVPKQLLHPKRRTLGIRVPEHTVVQQLLSLWQQPLLCTSLSIADPEDIIADYGNQLDLVLDAGYCPCTPTSVIDLTAEYAVILREGVGDVSEFV